MAESTELPTGAELIAHATAWLDAEPDDDIRVELAESIAAAEAGDDADLADRFAGRLQFGTAGLRGPVAAGSMRMNRLTVRQAAAGLGQWVLDTVPNGADRGVVIARDARRKSDHFALDTARVLAAMGIKSMLHPGTTPTPVLAWSITGLDAAAGVVVTASHNPPADNGYKVYLSTGSQIVDPVDVEIAERIGTVDPLNVTLAEADDPLISWLDESWTEAYLAAAGTVRLCPEVPGVPVAYTAMHGVGGRLVSAAFVAAGFEPPVVVAEQHEPDGTFPTVSFPNPEEPGAMDRVIALAAAEGAHLAIANDPDADRLGVAIPLGGDADSTDAVGWRRLGGDEIGWLLADHILRHTTGDDRLVATTLVSSSLLAKMAEHYGVHSAETFTGFKWIGRIATERAADGQRFVFGYEQALGYLVTDRPLDKDGISAAVMMAEVAALAAADGVTLQDRLDGIAERFGRYVTAELSVPLPPVLGAQWVESIEAAPPGAVGGIEVEAVSTYPQANLVRLVLVGGIRLQIRPSGTEPKVKLYCEAVDRDAGELAALLADLASTAPPGA